MMKFVQLCILLIYINSIQGKLIVHPVPSTVEYNSSSGISTCKKCQDGKFYPDMFASLDNLNFDCEIPHVKKICDGHEEVTVNIKNPIKNNGLICENGSPHLNDCNEKRILNNTIVMSFNCSFLLDKLGVSNTRDNQVSFTSASEVSLNETTDCNNNGTSSWNIIQSNPTKYPTMYPLTTSNCYSKDNFIGNEVQKDIVNKCKTASITTRIIKLRKTNFITKQNNYLTEIKNICVNENVAENVDHTVLFEDLASQIDASGQKTEIQSLVEDQQVILNGITKGDCDVSHFTDEYASTYDGCSLVKDIRDKERSRRNLTDNNCDLNRAELDHSGTLYNDLNTFDYFWSFNVTEAINSMCYGAKNAQDDLGGDDGAGLAIKIDSDSLLTDYGGHSQYYGFFSMDNGDYDTTYDSEQYSNDYCRDIDDAKTKADSLIPDVDLLYTYYKANSSLTSIQSKCNEFATKRLDHYINQAGAWFSLHSADFADENSYNHDNLAPETLLELCDLINDHGTLPGHSNEHGGYGGDGGADANLDDVVQIDRDTTALNFGSDTYTCEQLLNGDKTKIYPHLKRVTRHERKLVSISWDDNAYVSGQMINQYASLKDVAMAFLNEANGQPNQTRVDAQLIREKNTICNFTPQEATVANVLAQIKQNFTTVKSALDELGFDTDVHGIEFFDEEAKLCGTYPYPTLTLSEEESAYKALGTAQADDTLINCANAERTHDNIITADNTTTVTELRNAISNFNIKNGDVSACPSLDTFDYDSLKKYELEITATRDAGLAKTQERLAAFQDVANLKKGYDASWSDTYIEKSGLSTILNSIINNQTALVEEAVQNRTDNCNEYVCALNEDFKFKANSSCTVTIIDTASYGDGSWAEGNVLFKDESVFRTVDHKGEDCNGDVEIDLNVNLNLPEMEQNLWHNIHDSDGFLYNQIPKDSAHDMWTVCALHKDGFQLMDQKSLHLGNDEFADKFEMNFLQNRYSWRNVTRSGSTEQIDGYGSSNTCPKLCDEDGYRRRRLLFKLGVYKKVENLNY